MQKIIEYIEERITTIAKILFASVLFLLVLLFFSIYQKRATGDISEEQTIEELLWEQGEETESQPELTESSDEQYIEEQPIIIDIKGAVEAPGVYEMESGSRVIDCVEKAGGFLIEAEQKAVNLAQCAADQMVIYIPLKGEEITEVAQLLTTEPSSQSSSANHKIDLNKASKEELMSLNGIGDVKADNIISYREQNGHFQKIEDLKNISGIGEATFEKLKEDIQVTP